MPDAKITQYEGTNQIQAVAIVRQILKVLSPEMQRPPLVADGIRTASRPGYHGGWIPNPGRGIGETPRILSDFSSVPRQHGKIVVT